jgi:hypothetical protein
MASPSVVLYQGVLAVRPAKAEPLLPAADEKAYRISDSRARPAWLIEAPPTAGCRGGGAQPASRAAGCKHGQHGSFISRASIFLPRYSGVRPTIRPATNTAMIANISMP